VWNGFIWLRIGTTWWFLWTRSWSFMFHKLWEIKTTWGIISFSRRTLFIVNNDSNGAACNLECQMSNGWWWVNYRLKWTWNEVVALLWHLSHAIEVNQEKPVRKTSALAMIWSKYLPNTRQKYFHLSQLTWYKVKVKVKVPRNWPEGPEGE
jgi:hypothetical protein